MRLFISTITASLLFLASRAFAHEEGLEITNVVEADWVGPLVAVFIIIGAIIAARIIRIKFISPTSGSSKQIINNNQNRYL